MTLLVPCSTNQILFNSVRTFAVDPVSSTVHVLNTKKEEEPLCLYSRGLRLVTDVCNNSRENEEIWTYNNTNKKIMTVRRGKGKSLNSSGLTEKDINARLKNPVKWQKKTYERSMPTLGRFDAR